MAVLKFIYFFLKKYVFFFKLFGDWVELGTLDNFCRNMDTPL